MRLLNAKALFFALFLLAPSLVFAGSFKEGTYTSGHGYTIEPPTEWIVVDRTNVKLLQEKLPAPLATATSETYDVLFFDPEVEPPGETEPAIIFDNLMVIVIPALPEVTPELTNIVATGVQPEMEKLFASLELISAEVSEHGGYPSIDLEWKVGGAEGSMQGYVLQSLVPSTSRSVVLTCTISAERYEGRKADCLKSFDSLVPND